MAVGAEGFGGGFEAAVAAAVSDFGASVKSKLAGPGEPDD